MNTQGQWRGYGNPVVNFLTIAVGIVVFVIALSFGVVLLGLLAVAVVVLASVVSVRVWWLRRKLAKAGQKYAGRTPGGKGVTIESEYEVIDDD